MFGLASWTLGLWSLSSVQTADCATVSGRNCNISCISLRSTLEKNPNFRTKSGQAGDRAGPQEAKSGPPGPIGSAASAAYYSISAVYPVKDTAVTG